MSEQGIDFGGRRFPPSPSPAERGRGDQAHGSASMIDQHGTATFQVSPPPVWGRGRGRGGKSPKHIKHYTVVVANVLGASLAGINGPWAKIFAQARGCRPCQAPLW
jgi:hypothetical protein